MKFPFKVRMRYWFDNMMARGTGSLILWLFISTMALIFLVALLAWLTPEGRSFSFSQMVWLSMLRTLDPGTMGGDSGGWGYLFLMLSVTMGGIFIVGTLVGILTNGIDDRLDELRRGRSLVVEQDHTVILGWSSQIFSIISELIIANQNRKKACIAILADMDKVAMEEQIRIRIGNSSNTHIVCRSGNPMDVHDLEIINLQTARSIIVISPEVENPDVSVVKTVLAIVNHPHRAPGRYHIVASLHGKKQVEAANLISEDEAEFVLVDELIARITAQTCRQSGMSVVYSELLDFSGDEIYFKPIPDLKDFSFREILHFFADSSVLGIYRPEQGVMLNPPMDTLIQEADQVIAISADDDTIKRSPFDISFIDSVAIKNQAHRAVIPERTLILGWNQQAPAIIQNLDYYMHPDSEILIVSDNPQQAEADWIDAEIGIRLKIQFRSGDTTSRKILDSLKISSFNQVIVLSNVPRFTSEEADAHTLLTLLHLRRITKDAGRSFSIVGEMLDVRNRELAEIAHPDDFIVSDHLVSLMLAQVSENKYLMDVFNDLFDPEGSEIYLKPLIDYIDLEKAQNFYTIVEAARQRGEVAIGYRLKSEADNAQQSYGIHLNPLKSSLIQFSASDQVIVLAES